MSVEKALESYDQLRKRINAASGLEAVMLTAEALAVADDVIARLRNGDHPLRFDAPRLTVLRQRLVTNTMSTNLMDKERENFLRNSADDDNEHNPFENWDIIGCDIVHRGPVETAGHNKLQRVTALVTEKRTATLG